MKPTVVVAAYDRPAALARLLASLRQADHPPAVCLIISIDPGGAHEAAVRKVAESFAWPWGEKLLPTHPDHLGLVDHIYACGALAATYGSIILLEDDLVVANRYYYFASQALAAYGDDRRVAGIALNALWFNGYTHLPFTPYLDDSDVFFLQIPWYQGQAYSAAQWEAFSLWRRTADLRVTAADPLHDLFTTFGPDEWFPTKTKYLVESGRTYVFPRESLTTNFGDQGTHFSHHTDFFQVPLQHFRTHFRLPPLDSAIAVYDAYYELLPERLNRLTSRFHGYEYAVDLNATKAPHKLTTPYVLTTRPCRAPLFSFGLQMRPAIANVVAEVPGAEIAFGRVADLHKGRLAALEAARRNHAYASRMTLGRRRRLQFWLLRIWERLGVK